MLLPSFSTQLLYTSLCCCLPSSIYFPPWLAIGGVVSAVAAVMSGIGLLLLSGYHITSVAYLMPFVIFCKLELKSYQNNLETEDLI